MGKGAERRKSGGRRTLWVVRGLALVALVWTVSAAAEALGPLDGTLARGAVALELADVKKPDLLTAALMLELPGGPVAAREQSETEPETTPDHTPTREIWEARLPEETPEPSAAPESTPEPSPDAVGTTITGKGSAYEELAEGIFLNNRTDYAVDVQAMLSEPLPFETAGAAVLILHTHGSEAFTAAGEDQYEPTDPYRTTDKSYNVVRLGDELERVLTEQGVTVIHDRSLYDHPSYSGSYNRAWESIQAKRKEHPEIRVVIDLHRDALIGDDGTVYKTVADVGGEPCAQVMIIAGSNFTGLDHPHWKKNLSFALKLQAEMVSRYPTLARPLQISPYRYNQNATTGSLIIEVGSNGNTLQEALNAARYFGDCLAEVLKA